MPQLNPRVAGRDKWSRIEALRANRAFRDAYATAREDLATGIRNVILPTDTYWLPRFIPAICVPWPERARRGPSSRTSQTLVSKAPTYSPVE